MKVLIVSFFFPPQNAIGGLRAGKMAKYLPRHGWDPIVLTTFPESADPTMPIDISEERIHRAPVKPLARSSGNRKTSGSDGSQKATRMRALKSLLGWPGWQVAQIPDHSMGWCPYAISIGKRLLLENKVDAIFSTSGPPSSHIVAAALQKAGNLPWIADFRDLWTDNHAVQCRGVWRWVNSWAEKHFLARATHITTVSPYWVDSLEKRHGKPVSVIMNGFDADDYREGDSVDSAKFTLAYTGRIYEGQQDPSILFKAVADLARDGMISKTDFEIAFYGSYLEPVAGFAKRFGIAELVSVHGPQPYGMSLRVQRSATALLYLEWGDAKRGVFAAKLFEYLGAGRPVLSIGPKDGVTRDILDGCRAGQLASDETGVKNTLMGWIRTFRQDGCLSSFNRADVMDGYTRAYQANALAERLNDLVDVRAPSACVT